MNRRVFMTNRGPHDYSEAEEYGRVIVLTEGVINLLNLTKLSNDIIDKLREFRDTDILLVNGHPIINTIAVGYVLRHRRWINLMYHVPMSGYNVSWGHDFGEHEPEEQSGRIVCPQCHNVVGTAPMGIYAVATKPCDECLAVNAETTEV